MALRVLQDRDEPRLFVPPSALPPPRGTKTMVSPPEKENADLDARRAALAQVCAEALTKSVQHFGTTELWLIGSIPSCIPQADAVEVLARTQLGISGLSPSAVESVAQALKDAGDLRTAARGARQAAQLSWLIRQEPSGEAIFPTIQAVAEAALVVVSRGAEALTSGDTNALMSAAIAYRAVENARRQGESTLRPGTVGVGDILSPGARRMARAAIWFFCVAAEGMARVCARTASAAAAEDNDSTGRVSAFS